RRLGAIPTPTIASAAQLPTLPTPDTDPLYRRNLLRNKRLRRQTVSEPVPTLPRHCFAPSPGARAPPAKRSQPHAEPEPTAPRAGVRDRAAPAGLGVLGPETARTEKKCLGLARPARRRDSTARDTSPQRFRPRRVGGGVAVSCFGAAPRGPDD